MKTAQEAIAAMKVELESELRLCERGNDFNEGRWTELNHLKLFLDTLAAELPSLPEGLEEAAEQYADKNCHNYVENESDRNELLYAFKAGASWMAGQGETMQITDDTQWEEVDRFVHRNCDGASVIQIRKK